MSIYVSFRGVCLIDPAGVAPRLSLLEVLSRRPPRPGSRWTWEKERPMNGGRGCTPRFNGLSLRERL